MSLKKKAFEESESIDQEVQRAFEVGQTVIKTRVSKTMNTSRPISLNMTDNYDKQLNENHENHDDRSRFLKISTFSRDKEKFEEFWALSRSLVDESVEPVNLKMARLQQCLPGNA